MTLLLSCNVKSSNWNRKRMDDLVILYSKYLMQQKRKILIKDQRFFDESLI